MLIARLKSTRVKNLHSQRARERGDTAASLCTGALFPAGITCI